LIVESTLKSLENLLDLLLPSFCSRKTLQSHIEGPSLGELLLLVIYLLKIPELFSVRPLLILLLVLLLVLLFIAEQLPILKSL